MNKTHEALRILGEKILNNTRTQLYLSMHFLGPALGSLSYTMDVSTFSVGTDAAFIRYNPNWLREIYIERPRALSRAYMHMLMHCLFRHMFAYKDYADKDLYNLCCDIAAESVIDSFAMDYAAIDDIITDFRASVYDRLEKEVGVLTAQRLYQYFKGQHRDPVYEMQLAREFVRDDHSFWARLQDDDRNAPQGNAQPQGAGSGSAEKQTAPENNDKKPEDRGGRGGALQRVREEEWMKNAEKLRAELLIGKKAGKETGSLLRTLTLQDRKHTDYREFLRRFRVLREEAAVDMDSFDYGFYNYGMQLYGNMPLIEENEYRISRKIEELAIVIDTSQSCQDTLVQQFLNETASILFTGETFFRKVNIHIIECDDQVQNDVVITDTRQMEEYAKHFTVKGGFGTDFRPAFQYVEQLRRTHVLQNLRGLLYFTDGFGIYPKKKPDYDTAFVFWKDEELDDTKVPSWALKLYI